MGSREPVDDSSATGLNRESRADERERAADRREREEDIREGILDRWERQLAAQALALHLFDEDDEAARAQAHQRRAEARDRRRTDAERRADLAIERAVDRAMHRDRLDDGASSAAADATGHRMMERLGALVAHDRSLSETLDEVLALALEAFGNAAAAVAVSLPVEGSLQPAASTAAWAGDLDARQLAHGAGPILDAVADRTVVMTEDLGADPRWRLADATGPDGRRGVISATIDVHGATGALTLYAAPGRRFDDRDVVAATSVAAQTTLALAWNMERLAHRAQAEAWERALESRDQIGQAKGILMEQRQLSADAAFDVLRTTSQRLNAKVRTIAEHVVTHRTRPGDPDAAG